MQVIALITDGLTARVGALPTYYSASTGLKVVSVLSVQRVFVALI
jgi:hypothetical protein